jgi:hypothetical protein
MKLGQRNSVDGGAFMWDIFIEFDALTGVMTETTLGSCDGVCPVLICPLSGY